MPAYIIMFESTSIYERAVNDSLVEMCSNCNTMPNETFFSASDCNELGAVM